MDVNGFLIVPSASTPPPVKSKPTLLASSKVQSNALAQGAVTVYVSVSVLQELSELKAATLNVAVDLDPKYGIDMGNYVYPLYTTTEEAAFHDIKSGGSGTYNSVTYGDDIYYMPGQGGTTVGASVPQPFTFNGITFSYDVISTGVEAEKLDETDEGPSGLTAVLQT